MIKKIVFALVLLGIICFFTIPFAFPGQEGAYNPISKTFVCTNTNSCLHEIGHKIDQESGWPSHSYEFYHALYEFLRAEMRTENPSSLSDYLLKRTIMPKPWFEFFVDDSKEAYAIIFADSNGHPENMPKIFREFYDWEMAKIYTEREYLFSYSHHIKWSK